MKHDDFADAGRFDLAVSTDERLQVQIADRAPCEAPELQVDEPIGSPTLVDFTRDRRELTSAEHGAWSDARGAAS